MHFTFWGLQYLDCPFNLSQEIVLMGANAANRMKNTNMKVLILEEGQAIRTWIKIILVGYGYSATAAALDDEEAMFALNNQVPDIAIIDNACPKGVVGTTAIRKNVSIPFHLSHFMIPFQGLSLDKKNLLK